MNHELGLALQAWLIGLAVAALIVVPGMVVLQDIPRDSLGETLAALVIGYLGLLLPSLLMTATFGVLLSAPLFILGFLTSLVLRRQIARHPLVFAAIASVVTLVLFAAVASLRRPTGPGAKLSAWDYGLATALRSDSLIVALPVAVGSLYFCLGLARRVAAEALPPG
jgi:hypothetical protein